MYEINIIHSESNFPFNWRKYFSSNKKKTHTMVVFSLKTWKNIWFDQRFKKKKDAESSVYFTLFSFAYLIIFSFPWIKF